MRAALSDNRRERRIAPVWLDLARRELRERIADARGRRGARCKAEFLRSRRVEAGAVISVVEARLADPEQCVACEQERVDSGQRSDDLLEN